MYSSLLIIMGVYNSNKAVLTSHYSHYKISGKKKALGHGAVNHQKHFLFLADKLFKKGFVHS